MCNRLLAHGVLAIAAMVGSAIYGLLGVATPVTAQVQTAVEYAFIDKWGYGDPYAYFVTTSPAEVAALDGGVFDGCCSEIWQRTGETFNVWSGTESGALPTCRFFNATFGIAHVYTPYSAECAALQANADWHWQYEGIVFYVQIPDENGNCPPGTTILYRLYNNGMGNVPIHRLTTSPPKWMLDEGWVFEGDGRTGAFACVPSSTAPAAP
jgi:Repeat of unknown function (DUF5648)